LGLDSNSFERVKVGSLIVFVSEIPFLKFSSSSFDIDAITSFGLEIFIFIFFFAAFFLGVFDFLFFFKGVLDFFPFFITDFPFY
jgi:hypothetical protein